MNMPSPGGARYVIRVGSKAYLHKLDYVGNDGSSETVMLIKISCIVFKTFKPDIYVRLS